MYDMILAAGEQSAEQSAGLFGLGGSAILYLVVIGGMIYFMMIRPQSKEKKRMQGMYEAMEIGDSVLTTAGFYGVIIDIDGDTVIVEFGSNKNCRIPMQKAAITQIEKTNKEN